MKKISTFLVLLLLLLIPTAVYAADPITSPESVSIDDVRVYHNLAETDDMLVIFQYDIAFTSDNYSTVPASDTFQFRFYDTDGTTLRASDTPYVYAFFESNGYGQGVGSFYLAASDNKPTWGDPAIINIAGSPTYFDPVPDPVNLELSPSDYTTATTQADNQDELKAYVLLLCDRLQSAYQDTGIVLKTTSDSGIVLSPYGEMYFRGAVTGLQDLSPELFFIQVYVPEQMPVSTYNMTVGDTYGGRLDTDDLGEGFTNTGAVIGVSGNIAAALIAIVLTLVFCFYCVKKNWNIEIGLAGGGLIGIFFALIMGDAVFAGIMIASLLAIMGIVWLVLLKRA